MAFDSGVALVIGVGSYAHHPHLDIPISVTDAQAVDTVLRDPDLCGYLPDRVTLLHDTTATRNGIVGTLDTLADQTTAEDTFVIYYCGHGAYGTDGVYYLTTHDTKVAGSKVVARTGIGEAELVERLRTVPAKRLLLLFNACHSGELSPNLDLGEETPSFGDVSLPHRPAEAILATGEGRVIITACRPEQKSWIGGGALSIFTQALVDGLGGRGYVPNNHGYVGAFGLYEHVFEAITDAAGRLGKTQEPELTVLRGVGPFPVALYRGASETGAFDPQEALPAGTAAREVELTRSNRAFRQLIKTVTVTASGERSVAVGGNVSGSQIVTDNQNVVQQGTGRNVAQSTGRGDATVVDRPRYTAFDQRGQRVRYQYNAAGDINFETVADREEAVAELRKLRAEVGRAVQAGALAEEVGVDVDYQITKAVQQAQKPDADKSIVLNHLTKSGDIIAGVGHNVAAMTGLATAIGEAAQMVQRLF